ncbi:Kinase, CMGC CDK [Spironucleus salmonicida]|uniref:Kinase, CMGC CDK n=1 Tax=Spironucleus salmonicida TaxID=348837 RepID=V6LRL2_9EUKA|nr:Kinase, CMGC CDK [Spironucleus salmonicida]|eukprot:EST47200.1 Kinase, CMGC CDK [Spironucleus salmonicida]
MNLKSFITIITQIGQGSFSKIYSALIFSKYIIAIKDFKHMINEPEVNNEILFYKTNNNPQFFVNRIGSTDTQLLLELGICDLFQFINIFGPLSQSNASKIFSQLLRCVQYLHKQGLAHRDIKPQNFILSRNGYFKLCDFGSYCQKHNTENNLVGNLLYQPIARCQAQIIDIYAITGILIFMLTGQFDKKFIIQDQQLQQFIDSLIYPNQSEIIINFKHALKDPLFNCSKINMTQLNIPYIQESMELKLGDQNNLFSQNLQERIWTTNYYNKLEPGERVLFNCILKKEPFKKKQEIILTSYCKIKLDISLCLNKLNIIRSKKKEITCDKLKLIFKLEQDADNFLSAYFKAKYQEFVILKCNCGYLFKKFCQRCKKYASIQNNVKQLNIEDWRYLCDEGKQQIIINLIDQTQLIFNQHKELQTITTDFSTSLLNINQDSCLDYDIQDVSISETSIDTYCDKHEIKDLRLSLDGDQY